MIINEKIFIKKHYKNINYYSNKGYNVDNDLIEINSIDILPTSHQKINCKCEICEEILNIKCYSYYNNYNKYNIFTCEKCCHFKKKKTTINNYGVDNPSKSEIIKKRKKETTFKNYGVEHPLQSETILEKMKQDSITKYGVEWYNQTEESIQIRKETCLEKYGVDNYNKTEECKDKITNTNLLKYNVKRYNNRIKHKETCLEKYGVDSYSKTTECKEKVKATSIKNGFRLEDEFYTEFQLFRKSVNNLTHSIKKELLNNWNGYDYYDKEYIKDNFNLHHNDRNYPTIDHKISVYYGFINDISVEDLCKLDNLCITKRYINSSKNRNNEYENNKV